MNDDKTINLTATINNQQYTVSYDIDEVKRIYETLGISSAVQPSSVASVASTPDTTTEATSTIDTSTKMDNTVKKNKVDELNKEIDKLFELRQNAITEICRKDNINDCNIDSDDNDTDSNRREGRAPNSLNIADITAKDDRYNVIETNIKKELENQLKDEATKKIIYDIVKKIEYIKKKLYNNENNKLEGYIYKYIQVLTAEEELNAFEQKYKLYYDRFNDKTNTNKTKDQRKADITPLNLGIINTYIKLRGLTGKEKDVGKLRTFKEWQRLDYTELTSNIEDLQDTENIQAKYPETDKLIKQLTLVSEGIIEYLNIIFNEYNPLADQEKINDKTFDSLGFLRNKLPIPRENKKSGGKKTRKRSHNANKQTRKQYPKRNNL